MADMKARQFYSQRDFVGLFRYLGPGWMKIILETLDDLYDQGFAPNAGNYQAELKSTGGMGDRLEVAMAAVLHKRGHSITWGKYWELYRDKLGLLPAQQHREIREYWTSPPNPGLLGPGDEQAPTVGNSGEWFVTGFGGTSESVVMGVGYSSLQGTITFTRADGTAAAKSIGIFGFSAGVSILPNIAKIPLLSKLAQRFPAFAQFVAPESQGLSNALLKWLMTSPSSLAKFLWSSPAVMSALNALRTLTGSGSVGPASLPSPAIGLVCANNGRTLQASDFSGSCVVFATAGTAAVGQFGVVALAFGMPKSWNPAADPKLDSAKGFALFSAASISVQVPSLAATQTLYWGEIV